MRAKPFLRGADCTEEGKGTWGVLSSSLTSSTLLAQPLTGSAPPLAFQVWKRACSTKSKITKETRLQKRFVKGKQSVMQGQGMRRPIDGFARDEHHSRTDQEGKGGRGLQGACLVLAAPAVLALGIGV
jgi:hypothetical protein